MKRTKTFVASLLVCGWSSFMSWAAPSYVNYQGLLNGADGQPLPTGNYTMQFNIYDQAQLGTRVWGPFIFDGGVAAGHGPLVPVVNGRFNVIIGPQDTNGVPISGAFGGTNRFMEITVAGGPPILPRQQFLSTAYTFEAINAQYAQSSGQAASLGQVAADVLAPPGSIIAFGGTNIPSGWLLCDGQSVSRATYGRLFSAISTNWGSANASSFNLPDLRGLFLRGRDGGLGRDPDRSARTASGTGGATGDFVGSFQSDAFRSHTHTWTHGLQGDDQGSGGSYDEYTRISGSSTDSIQATGGNETRPINAYVNYIIKY